MTSSNYVTLLLGLMTENQAGPGRKYAQLERCKSGNIIITHRGALTPWEGSIWRFSGNDDSLCHSESIGHHLSEKSYERCCHLAERAATRTRRALFGAKGRPQESPTEDRRSQFKRRSAL